MKALRPDSGGTVHLHVSVGTLLFTAGTVHLSVGGTLLFTAVTVWAAASDSVALST